MRLVPMMCVRATILSAALTAASVVAAPVPAAAQMTPSAGVTIVSGAVHAAASGATVEGAVVILEPRGAGQTLTAVTGKDGTFRVSGVRPAHYRLTIAAKGFASEVRDDVEVGAAGTSLDVALHAPLLFDVTVSAASRTDEQASQSSQSLTVVTGDDIARRAARQPNQMLREEPGVWSVQVSSQGSPIVRGQMGNRVVYLWDGIRINNGALFSGPNGFFNQYPVGSVDQIEVLRGPGAVQYGSDAIGGVINIVGHKADAFTATPHVGGDVTSRYGSVDSEKTEYGSLWYTSPRVAISGGLTDQAIGEYKAPSGAVMNNTGVKAIGGDVDAAFKIDDGQRLDVRWIQDRRSDVETYAQSKLNASGVPRIFGPYEQRGVVRADYDVNGRSPLAREIKFYAYDQYYTSTRDQTVESGSAFNRTHTYTDQYVHGAGGQATATIFGQRLVYGADARAEDLGSDKSLFTTTKSSGAVVETIPNGNVPPGTYDVADAFALLQATTARRLHVSAGLRGESAKLHSNPRSQDALTPFTVNDLRIDRRWNALTWETGAILDLARGWSLTSTVATGFRAPSFSDTLSTGVPVFASGVASVPSPNVRPEHSLSVEGGTRYSSARANFSITAYRNLLTDVLGSQPDGTIDVPGVGVVQALQNANIASAYIRGVESAFALRVHHDVTIFANASVTRGEDTFNHVPLRFIPPANGTLGLRWERARWWLEADTTIADRLRRHAPQDELDAGFSTDPGFGSPSQTNPALPGFQIPGWSTTNLRLGATLWTSKSTSRQQADLTLDVNNLFNKAYREAYSQQQLFAPGRGAVLGVRVGF